MHIANTHGGPLPGSVFSLFRQDVAGAIPSDLPTHVVPRPIFDAIYRSDGRAWSKLCAIRGITHTPSSGRYRAPGKHRICMQSGRRPGLDRRRAIPLHGAGGKEETSLQYTYAVSHRRRDVTPVDDPSWPGGF